VVGVGAIAALVIGATFALFSSQATTPGQTFAAGTVNLYNASTGTCTAGNLEPGDTGTCDFTVRYNGSLPAYIGAEGTASGQLANVLSFTINGTPQGSTPVLIGNSVASGGGPYTAAVDYTLSSSADNSYQGQSATVTVTFYAEQCSNNLAGYPGNANEGCSYQGPASWTQAPANGPSVLYNSTLDPTAYTGSLSYEATGAGELGNEINLAPGAATLNNVVVGMANFNATTGTAPITLTIYNTSLQVIATDTQSFVIPAAPDDGAGSSYCSTYEPGNVYCGIGNFNITFNFGSLAVPGTLIYGISYDPKANSTLDGVNVQLSTEPTDVSVGADTYPGYVFVALAADATGNDVGPGEVTNQSVTTTFAQVSTALVDAHGMAPYIPAVEFNS